MIIFDVRDDGKSKLSSKLKFDEINNTVKRISSVKNV